VFRLFRILASDFEFLNKEHKYDSTDRTAH
jgi:hypothetical protein